MNRKVIIVNGASVFKGGAEQVLLSFVNEIQSMSSHDYIIVLRKSFYNNNQSMLNETSNVKFEFINKRPASSIISLINSFFFFRKLNKKYNIQAIISTGGHGYWRTKAPLIAGFNIPHFVYPESPYFDKLNYKSILFLKFKQKIHMFFYRRVDALFVQTLDVKNRLEKKIGSDRIIRVISNTVNGHFLKPRAQPNKLSPRKAGEVRLLMLSSYYPHKNHKVISDVIEVLKREGGKSEYKFVVTLPDDKYNDLFFNVSESVINVGKVPINECPSLYKECDFMFLPSLLECFSASYVEAMLMRKPILTSDLGFAHTVCKDAAVYFNPTSPADIADKIIGLAENPKLQNTLIHNGEAISDEIGTPLKRAKSILSLCEEVVNKTNQN